VAETAKTEARRAYGDPAAVDKEVKRAAQTLITNWAENDGMSQDEIGPAWKAFEAETWAGAVQEYIGKDDGIGGLKFLNSSIKENGRLVPVREKLGKFAAKFEADLGPLARKQQAEVLAEELFQGSFGADQGMGTQGLGPDGKKILNAQPSQGYALAMLRNMAAELNTKEAKDAGRTPIHPDTFSKIEDALTKKFSQWRAGYEGDADLRYKAASQIWERAGHDITAIPESLKIQLQATDDWHKLEAQDKHWHAAKEGEPATPAQRQAFAQFMIDLETKPHAFDNMDAAKFEREIGSQLHPRNHDHAALRLASAQGRPDKLTAGLAPIMSISGKRLFRDRSERN